MVKTNDLAEWGRRQHDPSHLAAVLRIGSRIEQDSTVVRRHPHLEWERSDNGKYQIFVQILFHFVRFSKEIQFFHSHPYMERRVALYIHKKVLFPEYNGDSHTLLMGFTAGSYMGSWNQPWVRCRNIFHCCLNKEGSHNWFQ